MSEEAEQDKGIRSIADLLKQQAEKGETIDDLADPTQVTEEAEEVVTGEVVEEGKGEVTKEEVSEDDFGFKNDDETKKAADKDDTFNQDSFDAEFPDPEGADEKAINKWQKIKGELKAARENALESKRGVADREELEAKMAELQDKADRLEESEALLETFKESDYKLRVESSKEYQDAVAKPVQAISDEATQLSEDYGLLRDDVIDILAITNRKARTDAINALMPDFNEETGESNASYKQSIANELTAMSNDYDKACNVQKDMMNSAKVTSETQQAARQEKDKAASETSQQVYRQELKNVQKEFDSVNLSEANRAKANKAFKSASAMNISTESADNQGYATAAGAILPSILKENREQAALIKELEGGVVKTKQSSTNLAEGATTEDKAESATRPSFAAWAAANAR